ncbi:Elongation factor Ts, mitochondrial [Basidiobolus ranarum]|uniref:Elongation factor Ts, mitochondrial n=1 Tax=Basidiobolus ranarum TaxID=34480 RepID=A0ABR2W401_9FUNG
MSMNRVWNGLNVLTPRLGLTYTSANVMLPIQNRLFSHMSCNLDAVKPNIKLLAKLRQETQVSMTKAKEALVKSENDYEKALEWLQEDAIASGAKKAEKLAGRTASEGLVALVLNNSTSEFGTTSTGALVDLSCETDFVSRNELFQQLATRISSTALLLGQDVAPNSSEVFKAINEASLESLQNAPLMPHPSSTEAAIEGTVQEGIAETIGKLGENIVLRRVAVSTGVSNESGEKLITSGYIHGGDQNTGKIGALVVLGVAEKLEQSEELQKFARQLARQVVGFNPKYLSESLAIVPEDVPRQEFLEQNVLLNQGFMMGGGSVQEVVENYSKTLNSKVRILDFVRYEVGEGIEKPVAVDFREEVMNQLKK